MNSDKLIKNTKQKFIIFSIVGLLLIGITSTLALKSHKQVVAQQASIQTLYTKLTSQFALVNRIALLSERVEVTTIKEDLARLKPQFELLINQLKIENDSFEHWLEKSNSSKVEDLEIVLEDKELKIKMIKYVKRAKELVDQKPDSKDEIKKDLNYLSKGSLMSLINVFNDIEKSILIKQRESTEQLNTIGVLLVSLCLFQIILVWFFVFKPLYSTILSQHQRLSDAVLSSQSASRSKTEFLANISHEIRTPMTAILGYADLLRRDNIDPKERDDSINIINHNASHLLGLIDEILDISKIEAGKFDFENEKVHLSTLLNEVYSLINVKSEDKGISLIFRNDGAIPETIYSDPKRLKQILFNIVGNAIKFTQEGFVELIVSYQKETKKILITISDSGCGIPKDRIKKLFRPFEQADNSVNRAYQGAGLGLVLSRGLAQGMGGDVQIIKSEVDVGTTFAVTLDVSNITDLKLVTSFSTNIIENSEDDEHIDTSSLLGKSILVVDDAKENARLFKMYLEEAGASVIVANEGQKAIDCALDNDFDLILLDLQMPGKDGYQVIKELRQLEFNKPIIALTAHAMNEEKSKTKEAGFDDHITKPITPELLIKSILKFI